MDFQFYALDAAQFAHLFSLSDAALKAANATKLTVTKCPDVPCRVSLEDAPVGEEVILVNYEHLAKHSPYRASHAVFVRPNVSTAIPKPNEVPQLLRHRVLSVRAFDSDGMMIDADVVDGIAVEQAITRMFDDGNTDEIHVHYAKPGCFAARVTRA